MNVYAVLTGDMVASSSMEATYRLELLDQLGERFSDHFPPLRDFAQSYAFFRGDGFQAITAEPHKALRIAIQLRLYALQAGADLRIAIGIGEIDQWTDAVTTSDGAAFRHSGPLLDGMKRQERIRLGCSWESLEAEFAVSLPLLDAISERWTAKQAEAMSAAMTGLRQGQIADKLGVSQPAISKFLNKSHWEAVEGLIQRFDTQLQARYGS